MRFFGPTTFSYKSKFTKNCKIAGYNIRKGDFIVLYNTATATASKDGDLKRFDHTRYLDDKRKKYENTLSIPFSLGKRGCVG